MLGLNGNRRLTRIGSREHVQETPIWPRLKLRNQPPSNISIWTGKNECLTIGFRVTLKTNLTNRPISDYSYLIIYIYINIYSVITCVIIDQWFKIINQPVDQDLAIRPPQTSRRLRKERRNPLEVQRPRTPGMEVGSRSSEVGWSSEGAKCIWLVVDLCWPTPLKNDGVRQIGSQSQLLGKIKNVLNHQPYIYDKPEAGSYFTTARGNDPHQAAAAAVCFPPQPTVEVGSRALWATARRSKLSWSFIHAHSWRGFLHALRV